jgi:hypothetical protein
VTRAVWRGRAPCPDVETHEPKCTISSRTGPGTNPALGGRHWPQIRPASLGKAQLTELVKQPPDSPNWFHEIKFDGYRMHARIDDGDVRLLTRTGLDWTRKYPPIAAALKNLPVGAAYLDGELCGVRPDGTTSFDMIQAASDSGNVSVGAPFVGGDDMLDYSVTFKEAGLGNTVTVANYTLSGMGSVTYQCFNHGGNVPQGTPFTIGPEPLTGSGSFPVRNGSASGTISVQEPEVPAGTKCTGNGSFCAIAFSYANMMLQDGFGSPPLDTGDLSNPPNYLNCKIEQP